jgi:hypothetical protein
MLPMIGAAFFRGEESEVDADPNAAGPADVVVAGVRA